MKQTFLFSFLLITNSIIFANENKIGGGDPVAAFSYYIEFVGVSADVSFLNESTDADTYYWDFGDGFTSTEMHPFHNFALPGIYVVCLTASNASGGIDTWCDSLITYYAPSADFAYSGDPLVTFTDLSTNYPTEWSWFFGDGENSLLQNPEHLYTANGSYDVCLSVNNPGGTNYLCKTLEITSYIITDAAFSFIGDPEVSFTDLSTIDPFAWAWDFGDAATSDLQNPVHVYTAPGVYSVCLTATNAGGANTECQDVTVTTAGFVPAVDFTYEETAPLTMTFTDASTNAPDSWLWEFADGETSAEQNPVHTFPEGGEFHICLTATNTIGSATDCQYVFLATDIVSVAKDAIRIYPNPATDKIYISIQEASGINNMQMVLYNAAGEKVKFVSAERGSQLFTLQLQGLAAGYYMLKVTLDEKVITKNMIIAGRQ